ncbi:putative membrane protein [Nocardia tenerifensis]|uniref:Putative membrane protein n=1 Tax=Nocardia tenerifensis TaxID=228006 RepID=A0A318JTY6_9NOCA|nr:DMT family transporter [Nocardia tenerifensis]PXX57484.1 putative membrane protein [Nocardia tenerifensis]
MGAGELLALASAVCFGTTHFLSALLARRVDATAVALYAQIGGCVLILAAAPLVSAPHVTASALAWGALSGIGTGLGVTFLYRGVSGGRLSVVVPLSDVGALMLPVLVGVVLLGERPSMLSWAGIVVALPALWLVSRSPGEEDGDGRFGTGSVAGLIAGAGFALQFVALARVDAGAGLWPLVASRFASVVAIVPLAVNAKVSPRMSPRLLLGALGTGALGTVAVALYTWATWQQLLAIAVVLAALYPVIPVVLGLTVLRERISRTQAFGLVLAAGAIAGIALA